VCNVADTLRHITPLNRYDAMHCHYITAQHSTIRNYTTPSQYNITRHATILHRHITKQNVAMLHNTVTRRNYTLQYPHSTPHHNTSPIPYLVILYITITLQHNTTRHGTTPTLYTTKLCHSTSPYRYITLPHPAFTLDKLIPI
jgi:hypothetical protein